MAAQSVAASLAQLLRDIYDDDDFVDGVIAVARNDENRSIITAFIEYARNIGDEVTSDDVLMLALRLAHDGPIKNRH